MVKGRAFYEPGDPKLTSLFRRGFRAWQGDLKRHGALELEVGPTGFWSSRPRSAITRSELGGLAAECCARGLRRVRFEMDIDAEALAAFVELLASDRTVIDANGGFERALYARVPAGIVVNGAPPKLEAKKPKPAKRSPVAQRHRGANPGAGREAGEPLAGAGSRAYRRRPRPAVRRRARWRASRDSDGPGTLPEPGGG